MYSRKDTSSNYIEFSKNLTRIGGFVWFQNSYDADLYFEPCFQLLQINNLGQFEKSQQSYLSEKEGEAISAIRNAVIHDAENLVLVPIYQAKSGKESNMDQELEICNRVYEIATYNMRRVCRNQVVQCEQASLHSDSTLHCKRELSNETSCLCHL